MSCPDFLLDHKTSLHCYLNANSPVNLIFGERNSPPLKPIYKVIYASLFIHRDTPDEALSAHKSLLDLDLRTVRLLAFLFEFFQKSSLTLISKKRILTIIS
jgi:hypothetical protein